MTGEPKTGIPKKLIAAKVVCCGGLLLFATGVLTLNGVAMWLREGGLTWLALTAVLAGAGVLLWRHRKSGAGAAGPPSGQARAGDAR